MKQNFLKSKRKANRIYIPANSMVFLFDKSENIAWLAETDRSGYKILKPIYEVRCV